MPYQVGNESICGSKSVQRCHEPAAKSVHHDGMIVVVGDEDVVVIAVDGDSLGNEAQVEERRKRSGLRIVKDDGRVIGGFIQVVI